MSSRIPSLCFALAPAAAAWSVPAAAQELVTNPTELVNPFIGTGSGGEHVGSVHTFPRRGRPVRDADLEPRDDVAAVRRRLRARRLTGTPMRATQPFRHADEQASPSSYSTVLGDITTRVATTTRAGVGRFGFPATDRANVLFKAGASQTANTGTSVPIPGPDTVVGTIAAGHFCEQANTYTVHFAAVFDRPFASTGTFQDSTVTPGGTAIDGPRAGAWVSFDTRERRQVGLLAGARSSASPAACTCTSPSTAGSPSSAGSPRRSRSTTTTRARTRGACSTKPTRGALTSTRSP